MRLLGYQRFVREGDWYAGVDIGAGFLTSRKFENLMAFWPGLQTLIGAVDALVRQGYIASPFFLRFLAEGALSLQ